MAQRCRLARTGRSTFVSDVHEAGVPVLLVVPAGPCTSCRISVATSDPAASYRSLCVDAESSAEIGALYGVSHLPTVLIFRAGKVVRRLVGEPLPDVVETILRTEVARSRRG